jgi:dipeptidyl aminopeptidase/acylaminoacyl peptidase
VEIGGHDRYDSLQSKICVFQSEDFMRRLLFVALLLSVTLCPAVAQSQETVASTFSAMDIFELEYVDDPRLSPNGNQVVYVRRSFDVMTDGNRQQLWIANSNGSDHRPLLADSHSHSSPRWSPDGKRLAYLSNASGSQQLYVRWLDSGDTAVLTNLAMAPRNISWSPSGGQIAFVMSVPSKDKPLSVNMPAKPKGAKWSDDVIYVSKAKYQTDGKGIIDTAFDHVFVVPALGGTSRQLTSGDFNHQGNLSWAADGEHIFVSANRRDDWEFKTREADLFAIALADGSLRQVTDAAGAETHPLVSPDGKRIAYLKSDDKALAYRPRELVVMDIDGSDALTLTTGLDRRINAPLWSGNKALYFAYTDQGLTNVGRASLKGKLTVRAAGLGSQTLGRPYTSGDYHVAANGSLAITRGSAQRPADLSVLVGKKTYVITDLNSDLLAHKTLGELHEINYASSFDGEMIQGWYLTPPNFDPTKKYPLILEIHGGPHLSYGPNFSAEMQRYAAEGYVVVYDNHRGSTSYGERFALLLQYKYSSKEDYADHDSGVDHVIEMGFIDPQQVYITGGSAGGIASAYAIGLTDRYRAAAVAKPVINWLSKVLTADSYLGQIPNQFPGLPWDHMAHYWQRSPLSLVGNVKTPTLLITGEEDRRTPISETQQFYQALKLVGVDTLMVRVPGSPHGIAGKPSRMIAKVENILAWFRKYGPQAPET